VSGIEEINGTLLFHNGYVFPAVRNWMS